MLSRHFLLALAAFCACGSAFAEPGGQWRDRQGDGRPPQERRNDHSDRGMVQPPGGRHDGRPGWGPTRTPEQQPRENQGERPDWSGRAWGADEGGGQKSDGNWRQGEGRRWGPDDARAGVRAGRLRPLADIMGELQGRFGGRLLGQELANDGSRTVYRIRWMTADGRRLDLVVDAQSR